MNYTQNQPTSVIRSMTNDGEPLRQSVIEATFVSLEKQVNELGEQWLRCNQKIAPVVQPWPAPTEKESPVPTNPVPLAERIEVITRQIRRICDDIRETTSHIEL